MSRHRDIRNLSVDDYYDYDEEDDDYYYDEDNQYTEEENRAYYEEQQRLEEQRKQQQEERRRKAASLTIKPVIKSKGKAKMKTEEAQVKVNKEQVEKEDLVVSMGFTAEQARASLARNEWDVQRAINDLLQTNESAEGDTERSSNKTLYIAPPAPPPGFTKQKSTAEVGKGVMKAPAGWGKPETTSVNTEKNKNVMKPPPGWGKPETSSSDVNTEKNKNVTFTKDKKQTSKVNDVQKTVKALSKTAIKAATVTSKESLKTSSTSKKKISKELKQSIKDQKSRLSMVVLGHVDAGKSTLMGQLLVQLGVVQKRIVTKYQKQATEIGKSSFALAWIMDEDESERERGVTIDIATKHISTQNHDITILDAPGHADYVPAMITGAASADVGILVIAASPGEFESGFDYSTSSGGIKGHVGQTREHIILSRGLGVSQLIVAVNKLDAAEPCWSQHRFDEIKGRLRPFLKSNGFDMKRVQFVPISGLSGVNVKVPPNNQDGNSTGPASWYKGQTLVNAIDKFEPSKRNIEKPFRLVVSDVYSEGKFVVAKGKVVQGLISMGDKIAVLPFGDEATVIRIEYGIPPSMSNNKLDGERLSTGMAGDAVEMYLNGIDIARINVGNIISDFDSNLRPKLKKKLKARILVMDRLTVPIIQGSQVLLHMHSLDVPAVITKIISKSNKKDGGLIDKPRVLTGGSNATVEIKLNEKICLEQYNECRALGRFALRRGGDTVAVGIVESLS
mmetsp:Transcript_437/g.608  ORF Transcript_437/g.608 Transcript_437/m.608 type:complete len:734 (-) Transcript_437:86-2287(-)